MGDESCPARDRIALADPRSGGSGCLQHRDFHQVVCENPVPGPDPGTVDAIQAGTVPPVAVPEGADPPFTAGATFDQCVERGSAFVPLPRGPGLAFSGNGNGSNHLSTDVLAGTRRGRVATAAIPTAMLLWSELPCDYPAHTRNGGPNLVTSAVDREPTTGWLAGSWRSSPHSR